MTLARYLAMRDKENEYYYPTHAEVAKDYGATMVHYDVVDTTRWGQIVEYIYKKDTEYAKVVYQEGSGDSEIDYDPTWTAVRPVEKMIVAYEDLDE